jgi:phosphoribosylamine---glycine ligase
MASRILIVGSGGREHALAWRLAGEGGVERVFVAPGNPGMWDVATPLGEPGGADADGLADVAQREGIDLVVIGPEAPLVGGLADALAARGLLVFGPGAAAARLEGSKGFCREVGGAAGVPMAEGRTFDDHYAAAAFARSLGGGVAVKADGLAGGKGVVMCADPAQAERAIRDSMATGIFGEAGRRVVIERALDGREVSVIAICDEGTCLALPVARDHKRLLDGDRGLNTGGMGAVSPPGDLDDASVARIVSQFHRPVLAELAHRGIPFRGALFGGFMLTDDGPKLLEFNVRLGDPETQAQLPRLALPLAPLLEAAARNELRQAAAAAGITGELLPVRAGAAAAVVLAAPGYPGTPTTGALIEGIPAARDAGGLVLCAGVAADADGALVTAGGRVLAVVGEGPDAEAAASIAYRAASHIRFPGVQLRRDIGRGGIASLAGWAR